MDVGQPLKRSRARLGFALLEAATCAKGGEYEASLQVVREAVRGVDDPPATPAEGSKD